LCITYIYHVLSHNALRQPIVHPSVHLFTKMRISEKDLAQDSKSRDSEPSPHSDVEIGSVAYVNETSKNGDEALRFLKDQHDVGEMTPEDEQRLLRKIDWMIMPLMWSCYCLQYLDKTLGKPGAPRVKRVHILTSPSQLCGSHGPLRRR
jgi:hypothetical protein